MVSSLQSWHCSFSSFLLCFLLVFEVLEWNPGPVASSSFRFRSLQSIFVLGIQHFIEFAPGLVSREAVEGCVTGKNPQRHKKRVE